MLNLSPANINDSECNIYGTTILGEGKAKNKTIRNNKGNNKGNKNKVKQEKMNILENIEKLYNEDNDDIDDDESNLENFVGEKEQDEQDGQEAQGHGQERQGPGPGHEQEQEEEGQEGQDNLIDGFDNFESSNMNNYFNKSVPMYNESSIQHVEKDEFLKKLNYMIHLLEEQRNENTKHITEDLILYSFLGIFMIFVLDSFARVGKYVR